MTAISFEKHLPWLFLQQLECHDENEPFSVRMPAAIMMTDISGFSALALELTRDQAQGVETLQEILDSYFGALGAVVDQYGGDIATFAGDALIAVWPSDENMQNGASSAVRCALSIQEQSKSWWNGRDLTQRIAVSCGEMLVSKLGGDEGKWLNVFLGQPVVDAGCACDVTTPGQVLVTPEVAALLQGQLHGDATAEGYLRAERLDGADPPPRSGTDTHPHFKSERLARYLPDVLVRRASAGQDEWLAEFRVVTSMFVKLENVEFDSVDTLDRLQHMTRTIQQSVHRYGGALPYVQMDDKGLNFVIAYGIPTAAYEDDAPRALSTGLEIQRALRAIGMQPSIGVATGILYCGECGAKHRRQYSMIGPAINFAARLAGAAPDDLLNDEETTKAAGERLSFTIAQNVRPKHAESAVLAFRPEWRQNPPSGDRVSAMVGRAAELAQLVSALQAACSGHGARLLVTGEPGIGKSRLLRELRTEAAALGMTVLASDAESVEHNTPYFLWRGLLRALLTRLGAPGEALRETVRRHLQDDPMLRPWESLLNDILPLALPDTDLTREMRGTARASSIQGLLLHLVERACEQGPLVLIADDLHWIDEPSGRVLIVLAEGAHALSIVVGTRPLEEYHNPVAEDFFRDPALSRIALDALTPTQTADMVARLCGVASVPPELSQLIHSRGDGNPFYIQQLTLLLREAGHIEIVGGRCNVQGDIAGLVAHALPDTLRGLITSRVDRLPDEQQLALKVASVFGRMFTGTGLAAILPVAEQGRRIADLLLGLAGSNLIASEGGDSYAFSHALVQEAIYDLLPMAQRKRQHRRIADWLEEQHGALMTGYFGLLANHCMLAEEFPRAVNHLEGGAKTAIRDSAYREAIRHIETAQRIVTERKLDAEPLRRARWHILLGDSHHELTELKQASPQYLRALELLGQPYAPGALSRTGGILAQLGSLTISGLAAGKKAAPTTALEDRWRLASHAYAQLSEISYYENNPLAVLHLTLLSVREARRSGSMPELSAGYGALAIAFGQAGLPGVARRCAQKAIALAQSRPTETNGIAYAHLLALVLASSQCDWDFLDRSGRQAEALYSELGERSRVAAVRGMQATSATQRGRYTDAAVILDAMAASATPDTPERVHGWRLCAQLQLSTARGSVDRTDIDRTLQAQEGAETPIDRLMSLGSLAAAWVCLGESARALDAAEQGLALLLGQTPVAGAGFVYGPLGVVEALLACWDQVSPEEVRAHAGKTARACAILRTYTRQVPSTRPRGYFLLACQAERKGSRRAALALWRKAAEAGYALSMPYDRATALRALGQRLPAGKRELEQANDIYRELQVPPPALFPPRST